MSEPIELYLRECDRCEWLGLCRLGDTVCDQMVSIVLPGAPLDSAFNVPCGGELVTVPQQPAAPRGRALGWVAHSRRDGEVTP